MVRETRHLWVGNLPETIREDRIRDHFKRYGRVQSVKLLGRSGGGVGGGGGGAKDEEGGGACATVSFMDIKSAAKAHHSEQKLDERTLTTEYHEPAAIPCPGTLYSGSGPPNPPGASAGSRFSSHGGSEDLSGSFERSSHFYERGERSETSGSGYIRRGGSSSSGGTYHSAESLSRSRARDRLYRNGPYATPLIERDSKQRIVGEPRKSSSENDDLVRHNRVVSRSSSSGHHRVSASGWGYDSPSPRYSASGVPSTPEHPYSDDRRETTPIVHKKHSKSGFSTQNNSYPTLLISISRRSGSDSASNSESSGSRSRSSSASSQSGSSTCSSASSSPASEKSCSTHSQQSSLRSGAQSGVSTSHTNSVSPAVHAEDRRPLAICVRNLPARSSDTSLKDGLYHEYKKHGKVTWVKVVGQGVDRYALVCFKKADDVEKALQVSHDKLFFGCKIEVAPYQGYDVDDNEFRPFEAEQDEFHPKATRTLFIGNLEKDITTQEIRKHFDQFGEIIEIDIKKQGNSASYAFCQFSDITSVVRAMRTLDGEHIGANRIKLGFGKSMHTNCVWVDGVSETVSEKYLSTHFGQFGPVTHVVIDRSRGHALVFYEQITYAQQAVKDMRGNSLRGRKLQVDYASRECQEAFYDRIEKQSSTSHSNFDNNIQASPQSTSTIVRVYDSGSTATSPVVNSTPTRYPTLTTGGSGVVVTTRFNTAIASSRTTYNRPTASSPTTPSPSPRSSRHGHSSSSSSSQRFDYNLEYNPERRSYRSYEENPSCEDGGTLTTPVAGSGEIRHLQKERVALIEQLEDYTSSGDDTAAGRRRCSKHRRSQSGGEGSRPGTPLCDERPDPPVEPRRAPRERPPDPLSLPLPRFAAQVLSPRPVLPSPPASPQTPHSSSSDSEPSPPSPEWEERLRSLDEKYEKWSGSRSGVTKVDPTTMKIKHKLLELDLHELQPSEIVKSVLAKRSVFDEDSKRLENFGEKYEPREFIPASRTNVLRRLDMSPLSSPVNKSPGLQYPFPSHPPSQPLSSSGLASTSTIPTLTVASEAKPANTFLTNCTRQFTPKISSPSSSVETSPRPSTQLPPDKFKAKCTPTPAPLPAVRKDIVTTPPPKPKPCSIRRDSSEEKSELRRKSRDEVCTESVAKKDDISESDKVKDAQISERRKSTADKRRGSVDIKDFSNSKPLDNSCDRPKESSDKQEEKRRGSSEAEATPMVINDPRLKPDLKKNQEPNETNQSYDNTRVIESEKKKIPSDCIERRKDIDSLHRHNSTEHQDKKKDVLGVNSEKDRRRGRESVDCPGDNPKHNKKVPESKKETEPAPEKREKEVDVVRHSEVPEKKKESPEQHGSSKSREKRESIDREKRRDSREEQAEKSKSEKIVSDNLDRFKDHKNNESIDSSKKKEHHDFDKLTKKDCDESMRNSKKEVEHDIDGKKEGKHKEERRKNSETEISKEHSLFKKVFGFADSIRHHKGGVDRRDNDTSTAVKTDTPEPNKHREKKEKKEKEEHAESKHKSCNRKSPDNPENNRHKEEKRRHSDSKRRDFDTPDDLKQKEENHVPQESKPHNKSDRKKEDPSYKDSNHRNAYYEHNSSEHSKYNRDSERRKEFIPEEVKKPENDVNCLENSKKEEHEDEFYERRKDDGFRNKEIDRRKGSFDSTYENTCESNSFQKSDKKNDVLESSKYNKHDRHREKSKDHDTVQNCRTKEDRKNETHDKHKSEKRKDGDGHRIKEDKKINDDNLFDSVKQKENDKKKEDSYDGVKIKKDGYSTYRESIRETTDVQDRLKEITDRKKEEKDRRKDREFSIKDAVEDRRKDKDNDKVKSKHSRDYEHVETKMNGDHDCDYSLDTAECRKAVISSYEDNEHRDAVKKEKKRDKTTWPATIGCKRRLSSQDSFDINDESKRIKPERRDSKDSGRSSGSSRKGSGEKHKGYKLLEEKIKEDKERERKNLEETNLEPTVPFEEKTPKPASRKEKRNSGEKRKEERKFKIRPRENGTASESDLASGDDDQLSKASKRQQHSIFDIVDDEPAYISMYDKVKARSTKNMQKLEEEKKQEKLKEKFHALKQSRAKREEKKRSTSYDEDSDSEKGSMRRNSKLLLTSSEDDAGSEPDIRVRKNKMGILYDTSEDDTVITTGKVRKNSFHEETKSARKIISDISEDDTATIKHSTPKVKVNRSITFDAEPKSRKIMSDTSEDDSARINPTPRIMKPIRIHSDDSEGDLGFEDSIRNETKPLQNISDMFQSRPVEVNHFTNSIHEEPVQQPLQSSPESFRRNSLDSTTSEQHRKKSHKKKQKRQKNLEENEDGTIKKHSSKKEKKRAHRDKDDEEKRKKRAERESINKRDDKLEDIFGPLSDDSVKAISNKWNVAQVYGSDSESERENIRKKEKKRREKKMRELDEAGRAIEAKLMDSCDNINLDEPIKAKKKKRKKSRDEKSKHHQPRGEEEAAFSILPKEETKVEIEDEKPIPVIEIKEEVNDEAEDVDAKEGYEADIKKETKMECEDEMDNPPDLRQQSMSSLLDSPPPSQPSSLTCKKPGIPGFSSEIDDNIHETAVKSISESTCTTLDESDLKYDDKCKSEETPVTGEDGKPTTIISQEETEDAVAALLMEDTFGGGFEGYNEDTPKPDTPVSEPDLQIDTDTEDTYDPIDFSRPPRTPDIPSNFYRQNDTREGLEERIMMSLACSSDSSLKESPRPLQMPPTPDHKSDKKDTSDSDSFDPDKPLHQEKQTVVKNLMEVDEEEPIREPTPEKEVTCQNSSKVIKETTPNSTSSENDLPTIPCKEVKGSSETKVVETPMAINRSPTPPKLPVPVEKIVPPLDMPKLIVIPQKVSAITVNVSQPDVPSLAPLSNRSDSSQNFSKVDRMHPLPTQTVVKPQNAQISQPCLPITSAAAVISSVEATIVQSTIKAHVVNLLGPVSKPSSAQSTNHSESAQSRLQGWAAKVVPSCDLVSKPMPTITTVMTSQSKSQPPPLIPPSISQSTAIPSLSQSETISSLSPQGQKVLPLQTLQLTCQTSQPLLSQQPQSISQSSTLSQPPPLIQTSMSRPPPLVHTSHAPIQVVSVTPLLSPRLDVHVTATQSSPANIPATSVHTSNQPANFTDKVGHRLSINTLPPLKPVVNTHILQSSLPSQNKCNTTVTLSTPNQTTAATVRTIHPLASLTLVPTVKDVKSAASPSPPASALQAKQLHVITSATQLSPTPPISPQNLKLVRPSIPVTTHVQVPPLQNINIQPLKSPVVSQHSPNRTNTPIVPLLQTVNIDDHIKSSAQFSGKNLIPVPPNPQLLLTPIQAPHPEKVITLTPSQPLPLQPKQHSPVPLALKSSGPANIIKSSESTVKDSTPDAPVVDKNDKPSLIISEKCEAPSSLSSDLGKTMTVSSPSIMPVVSPVDKLTPPKDGPETYSVVRKNIEENVVTPKPIIIEPKNGKPPQDDSKPLNAVIQDLTMRAANKQQQQQQQLQQPLPWKSRPNQVEVLKSESSKPIEQVVRELAMRKRQASESKELEKLAPPVDEPKPVIEPSKLEEKSQTLSSNEPSPSVEPTVPKTELGDEELPKAEVIPEDPVKKVSPIVPIVDEKLKDAVKNETTDPNVLLEEPMLISEDKKFEKEKTPDPEKKPLPPSPEEQTTAPEAKPKEEPEEIAPKSSTIKEIPLSEKEVSLKPEAIIPTPTPPTRGGRGGRKRKGAGGRGGISTRRTRANNTPNTTPSTDIYEFRDDSEEETGRPRLILTIKSPPEPLATPKVLIPPPQPTQQPLSPPPPALAPTPAASGATTRKSRRLQEKDGTKPSNDDIIEDMITSRGRPSRRATRSTVHNLAPPVETTRKSPRRKQHQSSSAASTPGNGSLQVPGRNTRQRSASPLPGPTTVAQAAPTPTTPMTATSTPVTPMPAVTPVAPTLTPATPVAVTPVAATPMPTTPITATQTPTPPIAATPLLPTPKAATPTLPTPKVATPPTLPTPKVAAPPTLPTPKVATPTAATPTAIIPTLPAPVAATLTPTTPTAMAPTPALQRNKSPTPQRQPSPAKAPVQASVPSPVVASPAPATPQPPPSPPQQSPQASTPIPQPMPVPTTQPQPPPPPDAASPAPVVTVSPSVVSQPTPLPTSIITPSPLPTIVPVTSAIITSTHNSSPIHNHITTSPAPAHASSIPVTSNPLTTPVQLTTTHASPMQPAPGQPPPAHSGPAHPLPVSTVHPVPGHHPPSAHIGTHASAIKFRKTASGEPTKLIDPVTGLLIPMTESEEGQYIPVGVATHLNKEPSEGEPPEKRARLLNLAGKDEAVARTPLPRPSVVRPTASQPSPSPPIATPPAAHSCSVKIMVPTSHPIEAHLGRGPQIPPPLLGGVPTKVPMSGVVPMTPKSHILQAVTPSRMRPQAPPPPQHSKGPMAPKAHILQSMGNAQAREGVVGSPAPHQGALMTGSVASPPLRAHQQPIVTGASSGRVLVKSGSDSQGSRVGEGKHIPSSQSLPQRGQVVQPGSSLSSYEAPMQHSVVAELLPNPPWSQRHSPPPAHQNSSTPQQQGEVVQHVSTYPPHHHYVHPPFVFQSPYLRDAAGMPGPYHRSTATKGTKRQHVKGSSDMEDRPSAPSAAAASASSMVASPPLELRRRSPHDRTTDSPQVVPVYMHRGGQQFYYEGLPHPPPPAHRPHNPPNTGRLQTPPHASQVPPQADSLLMLLQRYPVMWQGLLALKNDQAAVQMHFVFGNPVVARESLPCNSDGSTPPLRIAQRMRLEQTQVEGVARKMQMDNEHCMLLALPCGRDPMDVLQQSNNLLNGFITYLQQKQAAGIVNIAAPGSPQPAYVVHIFPSCDFANESLARIAPDLLHRVADLAHLLIVIATV